MSETKFCSLCFFRAFVSYLREKFVFSTRLSNKETELQLSIVEGLCDQALSKLSVFVFHICVCSLKRIA